MEFDNDRLKKQLRVKRIVDNRKEGQKGQVKSMKKSVKRIMITVVMFTLMICCSITTQAKAKKLTVNKVYTTTKKVKGTTKLKKAKVVAKIGKKTYKAKSNNKGKFTIKIKKQKKGTKVKVIVYKTKKKVYKKKTVKVKTMPWYKKKPYKGHKAAVSGADGISYQKVFNQYNKTFLVYCQKGYYVRFTIAGEELIVRTAEFAGHATEKGKTVVNIRLYSKNAVGNNKVKIRIYRNKDDKLIDSYIITPKKVKLPSKTEEIDYEKFLKDYDMVLKTGKEIDKGITGSGYCYGISKYKPQYGNWGIDYAIGYPGNYFDSTANGAHVKLTAKNGATLYITVGVKASFNFPEPSLTNYDVIIKSGETKKWEGWDFKEGELIGNRLCLKIYAYKNNKLVGMRTMDYYLIQGYADWMFE